MFSNNKIFKGDSVEKLLLGKHLSKIEKTSVLYNDIKRFTLFSNGFVAMDPTQKNIIGDLRYSMLPTSTKPLWGIVIDLENPQNHADYQFFRENEQHVREKFFNMLMLTKN